MAPGEDEKVGPWAAREPLPDPRIAPIVGLGTPPRGGRGGGGGGGCGGGENIGGSGTGYSHRIAGFAEIVSQGGDEAEPAAGLGDVDIARRPAAAIVDILKREPFAQARPHNRQRKVL